MLIAGSSKPDFKVYVSVVYTWNTKANVKAKLVTEDMFSPFKFYLDYFAQLAHNSYFTTGTIFTHSHYIKRKERALRSNKLLIGMFEDFSKNLSM